MERVGRPGNLLLRYGVSQRSFENEASSSALEQRPAGVRNSDDDVDFDDVFGGPPTRTRQSSGGGRIRSSEESTSSPLGLPVFGESYSSPRRHTSDDFYDDIFRKSEESVRSPRWSSTTPGSRTLSPKIEPLATSVPVQFSLPAKMTKAIDIPVFGSSTSSPHRYQEGASHTHTPNTSLSRFSSAEESLYSARSTENETEHKLKHQTARSVSPSSEFHFSIHRWANIGVPLLMSLRGDKHPTFKGSSKVSALSGDNMQDADFQTDDLSADRGDMEPHSETGLLEVIEKEISTVKQEVNEHNVIPQRAVLHDKIGTGDEVEREAEGKENMERTSGVSNSDVGTTGKKKLKEKKTSSGKKTEANKPTVGSPGKSRVKGIVKDFFKISNQETLPKTKMNAVGRTVSSRWKTTSRNKSDKESTNSMPNSASKVLEADVERMVDALNAKFDSEVPAENVKMAPDASRTTPVESKVPAENVNMMPDASFGVEACTERSNKPKFEQNRTIKKLSDIVFDQMNASPSSESAPYVPKVTVVNIDDASLDNFQVQELSLDDDKLLKTQEESEAIKAFDSKIHLWSNGRKGNIRSLLSTLQLVLWPESGWKPVALVDIIEANAVKKAYNRAMLYLHPDKLQQKGADSLKKYMAEKILDILQEAWDQFNTLGTLL